MAAALGLTVRRVWVEIGSASRFRKSRKTPEQDHALRALEAGEVGALWVFRLDRWTRRGAGAILAVVEPDDGRPRRLLVDNGDPDNPGIGLDSSNERDRSELVRRAEDAREEAERLSQRVTNTKTYQRSNGEWIHGLAPYGLRVEIVEAENQDGELVQERKLTRDDETSAQIPGEPDVTRLDIARWVVYHSVVSGVSGRAAARKLNDRGVPAPNGGSWYVATIDHMRKSPVYGGWQVAGRERGRRARSILYRNDAGERVSVMVGDPVMSEAECQEVRLAAHRPGLRPGEDRDKYRPKHLLTGLMRCAGCGATMPAKGRSYVCWRAETGGDCPEPAYVGRDCSERYVLERWSARLTTAEPDDPLLGVVAEQWAARQDPSVSEEESAARAALAAAEGDLERLWRDRRGGLYDGPSERFFAPALAEANQAVSAAQARVAELRGSVAVDITFLLDRGSLDEVWEHADLPLRRDLLRLAISRITVTKAPKRGGRFDGPSRMEIVWHG